MRSTVAAAMLAALAPSSFANAVPSPFGSPAVDDITLAAAAGMAGPELKSRFPMSDELSILSLRPTASIGSTLKNVWLLDVAPPLVTANVRSAQ